MMAYFFDEFSEHLISHNALVAASCDVGRTGSPSSAFNRVLLPDEVLPARNNIQRLLEREDLNLTASKL